ncbi:hypothetical protein AAFF_G00336220 [Aldrovandia affinis]|uniref:Uncharacterized protein n=1 Tax=Aldrovandia affinis TaxID=143900 RepID=A0AAD7R6V1_9TELE|nr:hypothetical protein AAFF_G00336220 [Aldrovandia affinis]
MSSRRDAFKGTNRALKPAIEKKRRDRINQSLDELRSLLLSNTPDTRLQNPKLEKAEILELTVEYIRNKTKRANQDTDPAQHIDRTDPGSSSLYSAGFQQCVSRLSTFIDCVNPSQGQGLIQGLRLYLGPQSQTAPVSPQECHSHSPLPLYSNPPAMLHPFLSPPYSLSPPPSPCYTITSPSHLSTPCHFLFPPAPLSLDTSSSFSSLSSSPQPAPGLCPTLPMLGAPPTPHCPPLLSPAKRGDLRRKLFPTLGLDPTAMWRPWV